MRLNKCDEVIYVRVFTEKDLRDYAENANFWGKHQESPKADG